MKVREFFELFGTTLSEQKFEIHLNKELICCGYTANIPMEKKGSILDAEIVRFNPTTSNIIHFDAEI